MDKAARIRELNDAFRRSFIGGTVLATPGVGELDNASRVALFQMVQTFDDFSSDNDPHHEHDFVRIELDGVTYFGKIDYYAPDMESGSQDPSDPARTVRVLIIMRADEY